MKILFTFRDDLLAQPENGWALRGLHQALQAQGRQADAAPVQERLQRNWREADAALKPA